MKRQNLLVEIVSPDRVAYRGEATRFRAPGVEGSFEVLRGHAPLVAATGTGQVVVTTLEGKRVVFASSKGFVEVLEDHVIMLCDAVEPASEIDTERARRAEEEARERLASLEDPEVREEARAALEQARNRLRTAMGEA